MILSTFRRSISTCVVSLCRSERFSRARGTIRNRRVRTSLRDIPNPANPGVQHRLTAMKEDDVQEDSIPEMDLLENSESDFYNVGAQYREIEKEQQLKSELIALKIVKRKYFNERVPNFLTWSEKEQIRHLHSKNPEEWTPEIIADSFPTTPEGAQMIIKATWKPASQSRIDRHDASAFRNWKELQEGTLEGVLPELREHILKFTRRTIPPRNPSAISETKELSPGFRIRGEFSQIISSYEESLEQVVNPNAVIEDSTKALPHMHGFDEVLSIEAKDESEIDPEIFRKGRKQIEGGTFKKDDSSALTYVKPTNDLNDLNLKKKSDKFNQILTLDELRSNLSLSAVSDHSIGQHSVDHNSVVKANKDIQESSKTYLKKYENESVKIKPTVLPDVTLDKPYPERIRIPKRAFRRGMTYKVDDCFYDDDGRFLYRVPGMLGR